MAIGMLLLAVGPYPGGEDHGIGSVVTLDDFPSGRLSFDLVAVQ